MKQLNLNLDLHNLKAKATRDGYGDGLIDAGEKNPNVVSLGADTVGSARADWFAKKFPDRAFDVGIAEQNLVAFAAGMSLMGKIAYASTFGVFLAGRAWDQVRTTVCYNDLNVKFGGTHGGLTVGEDGATHQALEEIAIMRCLPNMKVIVPADYYETRKATAMAADIPGPVYIRFGRDKVPMLTDESTPFEFGKICCYRDGTDVAIVACGIMVYPSLLAAEELAKEKISAMVINCHTIKPIDAAGLVEAAQKTGAVVTAEEHQVAGGLGGAVAEVLAQNCPVPMQMVGVHDAFGQSGTSKELLDAYGLNVEEICRAARAAVKLKK